jgi:protein-S-isoprenylcysteine O-methyltransferase Ste14
MYAVSHIVVAVLWAGWALYWAISAQGNKLTEREGDGISRLAYSLPLWLAAWLLIGRGLPLPVLYGRFVPDTVAIEIIGLVVAAAGFAFAIWARIQLGSNWSATVTVKQDHALIENGPYAIVRHPIYTGLLAAIVGTALVFGEWRDLAALALVAASCWYKLRLEEAWMVETFRDVYESYRKRVPALIPFVL